MNMAFLGGTTGQIAPCNGRWQLYPYTVAGVAALDSVQFGYSTNVRVYYAYEWVVSEGCVGPIDDGFCNAVQHGAFYGYSLQL